MGDIVGSDKDKCGLDVFGGSEDRVDISSIVVMEVSKSKENLSPSSADGLVY